MGVRPGQGEIIARWGQNAVTSRQVEPRVGTAASLVVGVLRINLHLPASGSLKAKRQVVSGLLKRVRREFDVAAAEVDGHDRWQVAELAIACVSDDARHVDQVLSRAARYVEATASDAVVMRIATELLRV